jgi:NADPH-dependent 2,4-dienoyl-CoA reductase/sulfur reductase-like enzyme
VERVTAIDREGKMVQTADGTVDGYERLAIATGSNPIVPPIPGHQKSNLLSIKKDVPYLTEVIAALDEAASQVLVGGQVTGAKSGGESINAISACIHHRMTADDIATFQTGTAPALTASPISYQLVNPAELAIAECQKRYRGHS